MVLLAAAALAAGWGLNVWLANGPQAQTRAVQLMVPVIFGLTLLMVWELVVRGLAVPLVILPAPSVIAARFASSTHILWQDFLQTFVKGALSGCRWATSWRRCRLSAPRRSW